MRIAFVVPAPLTAVTGSAEYARRITEAWRNAGHDVTVHELDAALEQTGGQPTVDSIFRTIDPTSAIVIDNQVLPLLAEHADDLTDRHAFILHHHPLGSETGLDPAESSKLSSLEHRLTKRARHVVTTSNITAATVAASFGLTTDHISVIEPGTPDAPRSEGSGPGTPTQVIAIGSLIPRKGHDVLMRALARLFDLDWHLTIAGCADQDPACAANLTALPATLGIESRVTFLGALQGQTLADLWRRADIFALATHYEGYGMAIAEALKRGLPVAVCGGGAAGALITPGSGVVCPPGDVDQLSKALRRLLFDTTLRASYADAAWAIGQSLPDWSRQATAFAKVLETHAFAQDD